MSKLESHEFAVTVEYNHAGTKAWVKYGATAGGDVAPVTLAKHVWKELDARIAELMEVAK